MTSETYIALMKSYIGTSWDIDGFAGFQCVDYFKIGLKELKIPIYSTGTGWASGYWKNRETNGSRKYFDFIPPDKLKPGDWVFMTNPEHVALFIGGNKILGGNQHGKNDPVDIVRLSDYKTVLGGFRAKSFTGKVLTNLQTPYLVRVTITNLNIREKADVYSKSNGHIKPGAYTIIEEKENNGYLWGRLKSGAGWIALDFTQFLWEV